MTGGQFDPALSASTSLGHSALVQSTERYASMFIHHPHAAYSVDARGYFTDANAHALQMTGLSLQQMRESHFAEVIHPADLAVIEGGFAHAMTGQPQLEEARVVSAEGVVTDIRCTMIPVVVSGEVVGVHGVAEDITAAKRTLRELEEANVAKTLFLATVGHEVRTPLAALIGATDLLMESPTAPDAAHYMQLIHRSGQRLMHLVDDLLEFSGLEANQIVLHPQPFEVRAVLAGISEWAVPFAESRDLVLSLVVDESLPPTVVGDVRRVTQVVTNLVQNAITFTSCGSVAVRVRGTGPWVEIAVSDTGVGISKENIDVLFEPFTQADRFVAKEHRGIGLGLAICRALADRMGGSLEVASEPGVGSTFTFGFPLEPLRP